MTDDEKRIELLTKWNEQKDETIKDLMERLNYKEGDEDTGLKKALAWREYYRDLYYADRKRRIVYYWAGLAILAIVAAAAIMKILL